MTHKKTYRFLDLKVLTEPYREELTEAAARVIASGRFIGGREVGDLEESLAAMLGAPRATGVSNGFDALRLTLRAMVELGRLRKGDGVVVAANTFIASVLAILDAGLTPVFAEPDALTMNLSGATLARAIERNASEKGPEVRAVMPVHLYGRVAWDAEMARIADSRRLIVVEDAAQAIGAAAEGLPGLFGSSCAGALGHAGCFSFYPTKNVGALGDAGAVVTHDTRLADMITTLANYGWATRYHNDRLGFNCRLDPIQAALISVKLRYIDRENEARRRNALAYDNAISATGGIVCPLLDREAGPRWCVWHQYVIRSSRRDELKAFLAREGVETDIHYPVPCHVQPAVVEMASRRGGTSLPGLPEAERMAGEVLSLPISSATSPEEAAEIACIINSFA